MPDTGRRPRRPAPLSADPSRSRHRLPITSAPLGRLRGEHHLVRRVVFALVLAATFGAGASCSSPAGNTNADAAAGATSPAASVSTSDQTKSTPADQVWVAQDRVITTTGSDLRSAPVSNLDDSVAAEDVWDAAVAGTDSQLLVILRRHRTEQAGVQPASETWEALGLDPTTLEQRWATSMPIPHPDIDRSSPVHVLPVRSSPYAVVAAPDSGPSTLSGVLYGLEATTGKLLWTTGGLPLSTPARAPVPVIAADAGGDETTTHLLVDQRPVRSVDVSTGDVVSLDKENVDDDGTFGDTATAWNLVFSGDMTFDVTTGQRVEPPAWMSPVNFDRPRTTFAGYEDPVSTPTIVPVGDGTVIARHGRFLANVTREGDVLWQLPDEQMVGTTVGLSLLGLSDRYLILELPPVGQYAAIDLDTGQQVWSAKHAQIGDVDAGPLEPRLAGNIGLTTRRSGEHLVRFHPEQRTVTVTRHPNPILVWTDTTIVPAP